MINEYLHNSVEELKRVDHLVYVSLKYTRTVDVLLNIISRMIDGYDEMFNALLQKLVLDKKIMEIPEAPLLRTSILSDNFEQDEIRHAIAQYHLMRKLHRSNPEREQEYRRHVTLRTVIDGREEIVNIDTITQDHHLQKEFLNWLSEYLKEDAEREERLFDEGAAE